MPTHFEEICAAMVEAMDPDMRLAGAELEDMAKTIARHMAHDTDDVEAYILTLDRMIIMMYARAGKPYGFGPEARWRWWFEQIDA